MTEQSELVKETESHMNRQRTSNRITVIGLAVGLSVMLMAPGASASTAKPQAAQTVADPLAGPGWATCPQVLRVRQEGRATLGLSLSEAKACLPQAKVAPDGHMRGNGVYLIPAGDGSYLAATFRTTVSQAAGNYQIVNLYSNAVGATSSWTMTSSSDVWWGERTSLRPGQRWVCDWNGPGASCTDMRKGWYYDISPYRSNIWGDGSLHWGITWAIGCRHAVEALEGWTDAYCFGVGN